MAMVGTHLLGVLGATWLLVADPLAPRRIALLALAWIYFLRVVATSLYLLKRKVGWAEAVQVGPFLLVIQVAFAWLGARASASFPDVLDVAALTLYGVGSYLNTGSELQRKLWKSHPEHAGRLYTGGLFALSMHVNYFGDVLLFSGWALLTRSLWAWLVPAVILAGFVFFHIPVLDRYLRERYGDEFAEWERRTRKLIPFVY